MYPYVPLTLNVIEGQGHATQHSSITNFRPVLHFAVNFLSFCSWLIIVQLSSVLPPEGDDKPWNSDLRLQSAVVHSHCRTENISTTAAWQD